jgi:hypothetical protein
MLSLDLDAPRDASRDVPLYLPVQRISYEEEEENTGTISNSTHHQQQQAAAITINNNTANNQHQHHHHHQQQNYSQHSQYAGSGIFLNTQ